MNIPDCPSGKIYYPDIDIAKCCARLYDKNNRQRAYPCPECGGAHLTSKQHKHRAWMTERILQEEI